MIAFRFVTFFGDKKSTGKAVQLCSRSVAFLAKKGHIGLEGTLNSHSVIWSVRKNKEIDQQELSWSSRLSTHHANEDLEEH